MAFYVNEDKPDNLATVHQIQGPCRVPQPKQAKDGRWHGPFDSKGESLRVARETHPVQSRSADGVSPDRPELPEGA